MKKIIAFLSTITPQAWSWVSFVFFCFSTWVCAMQIDSYKADLYGRNPFWLAMTIIAATGAVVSFFWLYKNSKPE